MNKNDHLIFATYVEATLFPYAHTQLEVLAFIHCLFSSVHGYRFSVMSTQVKLSVVIEFLIVESDSNCDLLSSKDCLW